MLGTIYCSVDFCRGLLRLDLHAWRALFVNMASAFGRVVSTYLGLCRSQGRCTLTDLGLCRSQGRCTSDPFRSPNPDRNSSLDDNYGLDKPEQGASYARCSELRQLRALQHQSNRRSSRQTMLGCQSV